jgi:hypothetical protein
MEPDILIVDEVLAVGDAAFQKQCFDRIHALKRGGVTICVVSHDLDTVASLCDRGVYLQRGEVLLDGPAIEVVDRYRSDVSAAQGGGEVTKWSGGEIYGSGEMKIKNITLGTYSVDRGVRTGDDIVVELDAIAESEVENPVFGLIVRANDGTYLYDTNTLWRRQNTGTFQPGDTTHVRFELKANLLPGRYVLTVAASRHDGKQIYDWHTDAIGFDVTGEFTEMGFAALEGTVVVDEPAPGSARPASSEEPRDDAPTGGDAPDA